MPPKYIHHPITKTHAIRLKNSDPAYNAYRINILKRAAVLSKGKCSILLRAYTFLNEANIKQFTYIICYCWDVICNSGIQVELMLLV